MAAASVCSSIWSSHMASGHSSSSLAGILAIVTLNTGGLSSLDPEVASTYSMFRSGSSNDYLLCTFFGVIQAQCVDHSLLCIFQVLELPAR